MCLGKFGRSDVRSLTKEHVLSKSLGGRAITLTCKSCNNASGHKVQNHLKTLFKMNERFRGDGDLGGRFTIFGETVPVGVQVRPSTGFALTVRGGSPHTIGAIDRGFQSQQSGKWSLEVNVPYSPGKASAAIARAAYLAAFHQRGYGYILSEPVNILRQEIVLAMDSHSDRLCLLTGKLGPAPDPNGNEPEAVIIPVVLEDQYKFLVAIMKFQQNRNYWMFCGLPVEGQRTESMFADLAKAVQLLGAYNLSMAGDENGEITANLVPRGNRMDV